MYDPIPHKDESEDTPVSAPVQLPEVSVTAPETVVPATVPPKTQSFDVKMPDGSTESFTPEPGGPADEPSQEPSTPTKPTLPWQRRRPLAPPLRPPKGLSI